MFFNFLHTAFEAVAKRFRDINENQKTLLSPPLTGLVINNKSTLKKFKLKK